MFKYKITKPVVLKTSKSLSFGTNIFIFHFLIFIITILILVNIYLFYESSSQIYEQGANVNKIIQLKSLVKKYLDNYFNQELMNETEILELAEQGTNMALQYSTNWHKTYWRSIVSAEKFWSDLRMCDSKPPHIQNIHMNNILWQTITDSEDLNLFLYNAYYDSRQTTHKIRVIGVSDNFNKLINTTLWCLFFYQNRKRSVLVKASQIDELAYNFGNFYKRKGYYLPVLITCDVPNVSKKYIPKALAIKTSDNCSEQLNNLLRVIYNDLGNNQMQKFGVCVRALHYQSYDYSLRLLEWLELNRILGAHKVFLYSFSLHRNMKKVIDYYMSKNFVEWKPSTHSGNQLNSKLLDEIYTNKMGDLLLPQETLELNDCLYKNIYNYEYLIILDIDELIVPVHAYNWHDMIAQVHNYSIIRPDKTNFGSYIFSQARFYNKLETDQFTKSKFLYTMRHLYRANFTGKAPKSFDLTKNIKVVWNHAAIKCIHNEKNENCNLHWVKKDIGYLLHFRSHVEKPENCSSKDLKSCAVFDTILLKYNKILETNVRIALNDIFG